MSDIEYACPNCGKNLVIPDKYAGTKGKCNACGNQIIVPIVTSATRTPAQKNRVGYILGGLGVCICILVIGGFLLHKAPQDQNKSPHDIKEEQKSTERIAGFATPVPQPTVEPHAPMPTYDVVDRDTFDAPYRTLIELHAVVSGTVTELGLKQLLQKLYDDANATRGFEYHGGKPSHVFIFLYTSRDHFSSGMGQYIAMLSKEGEDSPLDIRVKTELISQLGANPEAKHGLSEETRKEVFLDLVRAEDRALIEAEQTCPLEPTRFLTVGQTFTLSKKTSLMPELEPVDPMAALRRVKELPPGSQITVLRTAQKNSVPWYEVRASSSNGRSLGSGWINSTALMGQSTLDPKDQLRKQSEMMSTLTEKYEAEIANRYGLTEEQLQEISTEGLTKNWPFP